MSDIVVTSYQDAFKAMSDANAQRYGLPDDALKGSGGDGTSGGMSDDWKESVDRQLGQLHGDVRALLNRGVAAVVALALMTGGLYIYFNEKFDKVSERLTAVERKMDAIEVKGDEAGKQLDSIEAKLDKLASKP